MSDIGKKIKEARIKAGLKQKDLSKLLKVSEARISQYENGSQQPKIETVKKIADKLGITPFELVGAEWFDMQIGSERAQELHRAVAVERGIIAMLEEIYGAVESKEVVSEQSNWTGHYYLVGKVPNTFVLYDGDINALEQATKASIPALVDRMKDTRPENEVIQDYQKELDRTPPPKDE